MDFTQFWSSMIATFIGFLLGLIGQWILAKEIDRSNKKRESKDLKSRLKQELSSIKATVKSFSSTQVQIDPLHTPVWDATLNIGQISLLSPSTRESLFSIYNTIREFNSWNKVQTEHYFSKNELNQKIKNEIEKIKTILLCTTQEGQVISIDFALNLL